jgi:hypothetical protein
MSSDKLFGDITEKESPSLNAKTSFSFTKSYGSMLERPS